MAVIMLGITACSVNVRVDGDNSKTTAPIPDGRWLNSNIIGNVTEDTPAELKDNFELYVNKDWIVGASLPDGVASLSPLSECSLIVQDRWQQILTDDTLTDHDAQLVHKLYALVTDWDNRDAQGIEPARRYIEAIQRIDDLDGLYRYMESDDNLMQLYPFTVNVDSDGGDPATYIRYIDPQGQMLAPTSEYIKRTQVGDLFYNEVRQNSLYMLKRLGFDEEGSNLMFDNAMEYETLIAKSILLAEDMDEANEDHYYSTTELATIADGFPIADMIDAMGYSDDGVIDVELPVYFEHLKDIFTEENVPLIRDWLMVRTARELTDLLDKETSRGAAVLNARLSGVETKAEDEDLAMITVLGCLPIPMDNLYIRNYCSKEQKEEISRIVDDFKSQYRMMLLNDVDWLSDATKEKAIEKLDCMRVNVVYPDTLEDWSDLDFAGPKEGGSLLEARKAIDRYKKAKKAEKLGTYADPYEWNQLMSPASEVNAMYMPYNNSINIMAGVLNGEIYNENMSYEQKLGGIGMVIGHEISHAFDNVGREYDKDGNKTNWWTDEDSAAFNDRVSKLVAWYDGFIPVEGMSYSGDRVKTEAIADMTSMKCLLYIARQTEGFDYDDFFRQYAKLWREIATPEQVKENVLIDTHPVHYLRVNATLAQFDDFVDFYGISEGDGMYLAPDQRVAVW